MFLDSVGIILKKNNLSPHKITILDKIQGKIDCITPITSLSIGALITYSLKQEQSSLFMKEYQLVYIPFSLAQTDILFFHHVLELIYYFTYPNSCTSKIFDLLQLLYSLEHEKLSTQTKKIFLLKLLLSMDIIPNLNKKEEINLNEYAMITLDNIMELSLEKADEKKLDAWLWYCVYEHPYANKFKTTQFLSNNRIL